jgi:hypothetical protein
MMGLIPQQPDISRGSSGDRVFCGGENRASQNFHEIREIS